MDLGGVPRPVDADAVPGDGVVVECLAGERLGISRIADPHQTHQVDPKPGLGGIRCGHAGHGDPCIAPFAHDLRRADGQDLFLFRNVFAIRPIDRFGLEENHRVGVAHGGHEKGPGIAGPRGYHHLETRRVGVIGFTALGMVFQRPYTTAVGRPQHHGHMEASLGAPAHARGMALKLVEGLVGKTGKLQGMIGRIKKTVGK